MNIEPGKTAGGGGQLIPNPKLKLQEQFHEVMRFKHLSERTETAYCQDGGIGDTGAPSSSGAASSAGPDTSPFIKGDRRSHVAAPEDGRTPLSSCIPPAPQYWQWVVRFLKFHRHDGEWRHPRVLPASAVKGSVLRNVIFIFLSESCGG